MSICPVCLSVSQPGFTHWIISLPMRWCLCGWWNWGQVRGWNLPKTTQPIRSRVQIWYQESSSQLSCLSCVFAHHSHTNFRAFIKALVILGAPPSAPGSFHKTLKLWRGCKALVYLPHTSFKFSRFFITVVEIFSFTIVVRSLCKAFCLSCKKMAIEVCGANKKML